MSNVELKPGERVDDLQLNGLRIIQDKERFCFGMDAVLLSDFAKTHKGDKVLDLCTGTAAIPILMTEKSNAAHFTAVEIQAESADMARRSVILNDLESKIDVINADINDLPDMFPKADYNVITVNPPYMNAGLQNADEPKKIARHEIFCNLKDVLRVSAKMLIPQGTFFMVHKPNRLAEIMREMSAAGIEPKRMRLVYPYFNKEPNMLLIEGLKGGKSDMRIEPPLIVYESKGKYTQEIYDIYGYGK